MENGIESLYFEEISEKNKPEGSPDGEWDSGPYIPGNFREISHRELYFRKT